MTGKELAILGAAIILLAVVLASEPSAELIEWETKPSAIWWDEFVSVIVTDTQNFKLMERVVIEDQQGVILRDETKAIPVLGSEGAKTGFYAMLPAASGHLPAGQYTLRACRWWEGYGALGDEDPSWLTISLKLPYQAGGDGCSVMDIVVGDQRYLPLIWKEE